MRTQIIETRPTRENWERFCTEPALTLTEGAAWYEMGTEAKTNDALVHYLDSKVAKPECVPYTPDDWSDMVEWANRHRRWHRAVLEAWEEWQRQQKEES
jgi:hypothetical protein